MELAGERFREARNETRTRDPFLTMEVLYQLSYPGARPPAKPSAQEILDAGEKGELPQGIATASFQASSTWRKNQGRSQRPGEDCPLRASGVEEPALKRKCDSAAAQERSLANLDPRTEHDQLAEDRADLLAAAHGSSVGGDQAGIPGNLRFERGEFVEAAEDLTSASLQGENLGFGTGLGMLGSPYAVKSLLAIGRVDEARELAQSSLAQALRWGAPATVSPMLRGVAAARGGEEEIATLEEAVAVLDGHPRPLQRAHTLVDLGAAIRRRGRRAEARPPLRDGLKLARRCGAVRLAKHAQQELQATGETVRRYAPIGLESLTPSERRVASLAASGMTNRQIAQSLFGTIKTVEAHLSAAYDKLDVSSRRQLPPALAEQPGPPTAL
jgi:DNA-binding CsgD family transcriptional regulator